MVSMVLGGAETCTDKSLRRDAEHNQDDLLLPIDFAECISNANARGQKESTSLCDLHHNEDSVKSVVTELKPPPRNR